MQNQWSFDFLSTSFERKWPMCRAHSPSGEGDQPNTVSKGAQQHTNGVGRVALFVCVAHLFFASVSFVRHLPMSLAGGSQEADLSGSASRRQCSVAGALSLRSWGRRVATPACSPFDRAFSPSPGAVPYLAFRFARIIENGRSFFARPFRRQIRLKS